MADHSLPMRICFIGDSFMNGTGDDACLGWAGRACAASRANGLDLTYYNLGIRRDTSADILARWECEARARLPPEHDGRLVFSFGANDCCPREDGEGVRVPRTRASRNARTILMAARAWRPTLMVGPPPVQDPAVDERIAVLSADFAAVCASLDLSYLDVFSLVAGSTVWAREAALGDGAHPNAAGYTLVSEAFQQWTAWRAWNGL
jgi:acyl-CoA thioesterase-1